MSSVKVIIKHKIQKNWIIICLLSIVLLAGLLRFYKLNDVPVSPYWDETAVAYNAYSILKTGRDEYGTVMPFLFRSFDDYKLPGNIYLTVIPVALFGLNEFSARFTSAFAGTILPLFIYFLLQEFFLISDKDNPLKKYRKGIGLLTSLFFAISPWSIQFSRVGFEANVATVFVISGFLFFLYGIRVKKLLSIILSSLLLGVSMYFYRSIIIFLPLFLFCNFLIFYKTFFSWKKAAICFIILYIALSVPVFFAITQGKGALRGNQVSVFDNAQDILYASAQKQQQSGSTLVSKIIYNRRLIYTEIIAQGYLSHFSWDFLFGKGDPQGRHSTRGMGMLYLWELPFLLISVYILFWKLSKKMRYILLAWILLAPFPASIAIPTPHALRSLNMLPMPQVLTALGVTWILLLLSSKWRIVFGTFFTVIVMGFFSYYFYLYYGPNIKITSNDFGDGYKQLFTYTIAQENHYQKIVITGHYWKPYIYALFYKKYNPGLYQKSGHWYGFDSYLFSGTRWGQGEHELDTVDLKTFAHATNILVALSPDEYKTQSNHVEVLKKIYNHNGDLVFLVGKVH